MDTYHAIGLMSGSSLDGLDIAYCRFTFTDTWQFEILHADVIPYADDLIALIKSLPAADGKTLWAAHATLGHYFGKQAYGFIKANKLAGIDLIASHGHTIFHFPDKKFTTQIGDGAAIAAATQLPVVCDFRTADIAAGGQGTPIVPIGDLHLFAAYRYCLNIGGISNISCKTPLGMVAFDICVANQVLNHYANMLDMEYDKGGEVAKSGKLHAGLLTKLNTLDYCQQAYPKSLDNSFSKTQVSPLIEEYGISIEDKLHTYTEHIAVQVTRHVDTIRVTEKLQPDTSEKMLVTGGGAFNTYLIQRIQHYTNLVIEVPDDMIVKFKEAVVIAFMGVLRMRNQNNVLHTVTGAATDTCGGAVYR